MDQIISLAAGHKWYLLVAAVIGLFIRALRDDNAFPLTLPDAWKKWKPAIAIGLGIAAGVFSALASGTPWVDALVSGLIAGLMPVIGHQVGIEWLRGGKELPLPSSDAPPAGPAAALLVAFLGLASQGCAGSFEEAKLAGRGYSAAKASAPAPSARCMDLDDARGQWSAIAKAAGVVSGAGGIASIPVNPEVRPYIVGGVVVFLTAGAYALIRSESASTAWVRECSL